ncbi:MAG: flippase [bacterium]|nr:flippase [Patescibacteria group bacterium]MDW8279826.1 flippase [bacterium]
MNSRLQKIKSFLLENKTIRQTIIKNTFWLSFAHIFGRIFRAIIIIYAARILGAENWGIFSYSTSIAVIFSLFMDFGINSIILKEFSRQTEEIKKKYLGTALILKIILIILGTLIIIFIAPYFIKIEASKKLMPFVALILAFDVLRDFTFAISRSQEKMQIESFLYIFTNINILIFSFILLKINPIIESFALGYVLGTMIGSIISLFIFKNYLIDIIKYFSKNLIKKIIFAAWPFALSGIFTIFLTNTDLFLIGWFLDPRQVGIYAAGLRIIQLLYVLPSIITLSLLPVFVKFANKDNEKFKIVLENGLKILSLIAFPLTIGGIILAKPIILFIFGKEYVSGASSFAVLTLTISIDFYVSILSNAIFAYDKQKYLSIYTGIGAIFNVIFDLILIPLYGIIGSAWATFFAQLISNIYLWKKMNKINPFRFLPLIKKGLFAAILMGGLSLILNFLNIQVLINIFISAIFYFIILYKIKEPIFQEIKALRNNI